MNVKQFFLMLLMNCLMVSLLYAQTPTGKWVSIDDKTGQKRAVIMLSVSNGTLTGTIQKVFKQPGDTGVCSKCPGTFKDKPIIGLQILWGLKDEGQGEWQGGYILDPKSGKVYRAKLALKGNDLHVRGYIGISLLGRTQVWHRTP